MWLTYGLPTTIFQFLTLGFFGRVVKICFHSFCKYGFFGAYGKWGWVFDRFWHSFRHSEFWHSKFWHLKWGRFTYMPIFLGLISNMPFGFSLRSKIHHQKIHHGHIIQKTEHFFGSPIFFHLIMPGRSSVGWYTIHRLRSTANTNNWSGWWPIAIIYLNFIFCC